MEGVHLVCLLLIAFWKSWWFRSKHDFCWLTYYLTQPSFPLHTHKCNCHDYIVKVQHYLQQLVGLYCLLWFVLLSISKFNFVKPFYIQIPKNIKTRKALPNAGCGNSNLSAGVMSISKRDFFLLCKCFGCRCICSVGEQPGDYRADDPGNLHHKEGNCRTHRWPRKCRNTLTSNISTSYDSVHALPILSGLMCLLDMRYNQET